MDRNDWVEISVPYLLVCCKCLCEIAPPANFWWNDATWQACHTDCMDDEPQRLPNGQESLLG